VHLVGTGEGAQIIKEESVKIDQKYLLHDDVVVYGIIMDKAEFKDRRLFLKPRAGTFAEVGHRFPIHGLFELTAEQQPLSEVNFKDLKFLQWVYVKSGS
jgi:hypothetical protein